MTDKRDRALKKLAGVLLIVWNIAGMGMLVTLWAKIFGPPDSIALQSDWMITCLVAFVWGFFGFAFVVDQMEDLHDR